VEIRSIGPTSRTSSPRILETSADVLEVRDPRYTLAYGADRVISSEVVDIDAQNPEATLVADLASPGSLPENRFDCVIVTQTLQY
jgi:hypothetical protein